MKPVVLLLCLCLVILKSEKLIVKGQHYDQENDWSWINLQDRALWSPDNEDEFHHHHYSQINPHSHTEKFTDEYNKNHDAGHSVINPNKHFLANDWLENYKIFEPLENVFGDDDEEEENEHDKYNKDIFFKVGEVYAPPKPEEPRHEVVVDDVYEQRIQKNHIPFHVAAGFGEYVSTDPSSSSFSQSPQMFDSFSVEKSQIFVGPENNVKEEQIEELLVHTVEASTLGDGGDNDNNNGIIELEEMDHMNDDEAGNEHLNYIEIPSTPAVELSDSSTSTSTVTLAENNEKVQSSNASLSPGALDHGEDVQKTNLRLPTGSPSPREEFQEEKPVTANGETDDSVDSLLD